MASDIGEAIQNLRASADEGRSENVRYRQNEIHALHAALRENASQIMDAMSQDSSCSADGSESEYLLAVDAVRISYESLDFDKSLEEEYFVKYGKDNSNRRIAYGLVAIRPSLHSRFYSIVSAVSCSIAAGNCTLLEIDNSSPHTDGLLKKLLSDALDRDTFSITDRSINETLLSKVDLFINQLDREPQRSSPVLLSPAQNRTICIVDRTADLSGAARTISSSRLSLHASSPYSPDLVIVNEFIKEDFIALCLKNASPKQSSRRQTRDLKRDSLQQLQQAEKSGELKLHSSEAAELYVVEILDRKSKYASAKLDGPFIILLPSTGLVDSTMSQKSLPPFLASFLFATPSACKFLAEQVQAQVTYINHIPTQLLIGPASPSNHAHAIHPRYTPEMFSTPRPQFIVPCPSLPSIQKLKELALKPLPPTGQRPGHAVGFFEQGIFIGLGSTALFVLPVLGWGLFKLGQQGWKLVGSRLR